MTTPQPGSGLTRRSFLTSAAMGAMALPLFSQLPGGRKPNVLFLPFDDLKPLLGCYGNQEILTPNIDRLAARGAVFLNNHCQQAVCGPTRASLMTGLFPDSTGVWDLKTRMRDVHPDILSLPQHLAANGYETTGIGKTYDPRCVDNKLDAPSWTIPYTPYGKPQGKSEKGGYHQTLTAKGKGRKEGELLGPPTECMDLPDDQYGDHAVTEEGMKLLESLGKGGKPFFLTVGYAKPHLPFVAPKKYWDLYDREKIRLAEFREKPAHMPEIAFQDSGELRSGYTDIPPVGPLDEEKQKELIHGYMACVSFVDAQVGRLLQKLEDLKLAENTVVVLWGDHGWHLGDHGMWCKHTNFEQATRAPLIMAGPGVPRGWKTASPTGFIDIFPTLCNLLGVPTPPVLQGVSLAPLFAGAPEKRAEIMSQYPRALDGKPVMGYTLRDRRYRLVRWMQMDFRAGERKGALVAREFYDYEKDPLEKVNAIDDPAYAREIARLEKAFADRGVAQESGAKATALTAAAVASLTGFAAPTYNGGKEGLTSEDVAVSGQPFEKAVKVSVTGATTENASKFAFKLPVAVALTAGNTVDVSVWARAEGKGEMKAIFQAVKPAVKPLESVEVKLSDAWQEISMTVKIDGALPEGSAVLTCHLGKMKQTVYFGGWKLKVR